jgi:hypothetical protein
MNTAGFTPNGLEETHTSSQILESLMHINNPIGKSILQYPGDHSPAAQGLPGLWLPWNERANSYELIPEASYTSLFSSAPQYWTASATIAANQYRIWTPGGVTTSGTRRIIRSNAAISNQPPLAMNPINWTDLTGIVHAWRYELHNNVWDDNDLMIGAQVTYNGQPMRAVGIITPSGTIPSFAGGNRPIYGQGIAPDRERLKTGRIHGYVINPNAEPYGEGVLSSGNTGFLASWNAPVSIYGGQPMFNNSRAVLTGNDNAPANLSMLLWRKIS